MLLGEFAEMQGVDLRGLICRHCDMVDFDIRIIG